MKRLTQLHHHIRRNSLTIGFTVIALALGTILFVQASALSQLQAELANQQKIIGQIKDIGDQIKSNGEERSTQIAEINRHIDCIAAFFNDPDRANKTLADVNTCQTASGSPTGSLPTAPQSTNSGGTQTPSSTQKPTSQNNSDGGSAAGAPAQPGFFQRNVIQPIKNLINGL